MLFKWTTKNNDLESISEEWKDSKRLSISNKHIQGLYDSLMYSHGFMINNRNFIYEYIPFILDEDNTPRIDERAINKEGAFWNVISPESDEARVSYLTNRFGITSTNSEDVAVSIDVPQNVQEDYTINEIIDQKQLSFIDANFGVELSDKMKESINKAKEMLNSKDLKEQGSQQAKAIAEIIKKLDTVVTESYDSIKHKSQEYMRNAKWYPYAGCIYLPFVFYARKGKDVKETLSYRKIEITPFNFDFDPTKPNLNDVDYAIAAERITIPDFIKRAKAGEYSEIPRNTSQAELIKLWNEQSSYEFLVRNFPDAGLSRDTSLRWDTYLSISNKKGDKSARSKSENAYGVIDYYYSRNLDGTWTLYTLLNEKVISKLDLSPLGLDQLPVILYSESPNIKGNMWYKANLAFRLLTPQLAIQLNNKKIAETENDMQPVVVINYLNSEEDKDMHHQTTEILRGTGQNVYAIYNKTPNTANNTTRVDSGATFYTAFLRELEELKAQTQLRMKEAAGITDFLAGTDSHSMASKQGLSEMVSAGLKSEMDVVKSHSDSLSEHIVFEVFFKELVLVYNKNKEVKTKAKASPLANLTTLSSNIKDTFKFTLESEYNRAQTNSIITSMLVPLAAQIKQPQILFDLVAMLPITQELKEFLKTIDKKLEAAQQQELAQQKELESHKAKLQQETDTNKALNEASHEQVKADAKAKAAKKVEKKTPNKK